jgi:hypothetical protein
MFVCTVKASSIKFFCAILFSAAVLVGIIAVVPSMETEGETAITVLDYKGVATVQEQLSFLSELEYKVKEIPVYAEEVTLPEKFDGVYRRYNEIQKAQGLNLEKYGGKTVMRYTYEVKDASQQTYVTLLIYKNRIIGGDVTVMGESGSVHGLERPMPKDADADHPTQPPVKESAEG